MRTGPAGHLASPGMARSGLSGRGGRAVEQGPKAEIAAQDVEIAAVVHPRNQLVMSMRDRASQEFDRLVMGAKEDLYAGKIVQDQEIVGIDQGGRPHKGRPCVLGIPLQLAGRTLEAAEIRGNGLAFASQRPVRTARQDQRLIIVGRHLGRTLVMGCGVLLLALPDAGLGIENVPFEQIRIQPERVLELALCLGMIAVDGQGEPAGGMNLRQFRVKLQRSCACRPDIVDRRFEVLIQEPEGIAVGNPGIGPRIVRVDVDRPGEHAAGDVV